MTTCHSTEGSLPPSPAEDRGDRRLSLGRLLQKLAELKGASHVPAAEQCRSETGSMADMSPFDWDTDVLFDPLEETLAAEVAARIAQSLQEASACVLGCSRLILPKCLQQSIAQELLHLAATEPCGLRGALIDLCVERDGQGDLCSVDQVAVDAGLVPTFHVTLVLRPELGLWPMVQKFFQGNTHHPQTPGTHARLHQSRRLSARFRAIKRKLYCSGELLIEECC